MNNFLLKIQETISTNTRSILSLFFVLFCFFCLFVCFFFTHFSCWIYIWISKICENAGKMWPVYSALNSLPMSKLVPSLKWSRSPTKSQTSTETLHRTPLQCIHSSDSVNCCYHWSQQIIDYTAITWTLSHL